MKKTTLSALFFASLLLTACGQKGPLVLETLPTEKTQAPLLNSNDVVPVEQQKTDPE